MRNIIKTERLILRLPEPDDAKAFARQINHADILRMTASLPMPYFGMCAEFWIIQALANRRRGISYAYVLEMKPDGLIGVVELFDNKSNDWEIGYWLAKPYWGRGLMSEAVKAVLAESFNRLQPDYINACTFADNKASFRLLEKLGFIAKDKTKTYSLARRGRFASIEYRLGRK